MNINNRKSIKGVDLEGKIIVVKVETLMEELQKPEYQIHRAYGGFGCKPDALGKIFATCIFDGEKNVFRRSDILGYIEEK